MGEVIHLRGKRLFTIDEAKHLLPIVRRITADAIQTTEQLLLHMESMDRDSEERKGLEVELNLMIEEWVHKIERLGCEAKGLWLVDFDSGSGYYCWQYGEDDILYSHGYADGFAGRRPLRAQKISEVPTKH